MGGLPLPPSPPDARRPGKAGPPLRTGTSGASACGGATLAFFAGRFALALPSPSAERSLPPSSWVWLGLSFGLAVGFAFALGFASPWALPLPLGVVSLRGALAARLSAPVRPPRGVVSRGFRWRRGTSRSVQYPPCSPPDMARCPTCRVPEASAKNSRVRGLRDGRSEPVLTRGPIAAWTHCDHRAPIIAVPRPRAP